MMTLAIGFQTRGCTLLMALSLSSVRLDGLLLILAGALGVAVAGLAISGLLSLAATGPGIYLPALVGALGGLLGSLALAWEEVRRG